MNKKDVKPVDFLLELIIYKGKNSLYNNLKKKKLISDFSIENKQNYFNLNLVVITFEVCERSFQKKIKILRIFFALLKELIIKGVTYKNYKEMAYRNYLQYLFSKKKNFTKDLLNYLNIFRQNGRYDDFLDRNSNNFLRFDRRIIHKYLNYFANPRNALIVFAEKYKKQNHQKLLRISRFRTKFSNYSKNNQKKIEKNVNFGSKNHIKDNIKFNFFDEIIRFEFGSQSIPVFYLKALINAKFHFNYQQFYKKNVFYPRIFHMVSMCSLTNFTKYQKIYGYKHNLKDFHIDLEIKSQFERFFLKKSFTLSSQNYRIIKKSCYLNERILDVKKINPIPLHNSHKLKIYFKTDRIYDIPKVSAIFELKFNEKVSNNIKNAFFSLFIQLFEEKNEKIFNEIREVWGNIKFLSKSNKIQVKLFGFSDKFGKVILKTKTASLI